MCCVCVNLVLFHLLILVGALLHDYMFVDFSKMVQTVRKNWILYPKLTGHFIRSKAFLIASELSVPTSWDWDTNVIEKIYAKVSEKIKWVSGYFVNSNDRSKPENLGHQSKACEA